MEAALETRSGETALLAVIIGAVLLAAGVAAIIVGPLSSTLSPRTPQSVLSILAAERSDADAPPSFGESTETPMPGSFDPATARLLGQDSKGSYWAASNAAGEICVIVQPADQEMTGSSCTDVDRFAAQGIWTGMSSQGESLTTVLLPDDTRFGDLPASLRRVGSNVLAGDISDLSPQRLTSVDGRVSVYVER